jgi:hypothetical protein
MVGKPVYLLTFLMPSSRLEVRSLAGCVGGGSNCMVGKNLINVTKLKFFEQAVEKFTKPTQYKLVLYHICHLLQKRTSFLYE